MARKGRISIGPTKRREAKSNADYKVLPLRMETTQVETTDAAWKRLGYASRMAFLRDALASHLAAKGEMEAAAPMR